MELLTLTEAAKRLGICRNTARKILASIAVQFPQMKRKFYCQSDIDRLIDINKRISDDFLQDFSDFSRIILHKR